jgi:hypothetical protein
MMDKIEKSEMLWGKDLVEKGEDSDDDKRKELIGYTKLLKCIEAKGS